LGEDIYRGKKKRRGVKNLQRLRRSTLSRLNPPKKKNIEPSRRERDGETKLPKRRTVSGFKTAFK